MNATYTLCLLLSLPAAEPTSLEHTPTFQYRQPGQPIFYGTVQGRPLPPSPYHLVQYRTRWQYATPQPHSLYGRANSVAPTSAYVMGSGHRPLRTASFHSGDAYRHIVLPAPSQPPILPASAVQSAANMPLHEHSRSTYTHTLPPVYRPSISTWHGRPPLLEQAVYPEQKKRAPVSPTGAR